MASTQYSVLSTHGSWLMAHVSAVENVLLDLAECDMRQRGHHGSQLLTERARDKLGGTGVASHFFAMRGQIT